MGTMILLDLMGAVALLLWGLHMVRTGIIRAFGSNLRRVLGTALRNRFTSFLAGMGATALQQSSTATALMTTTFAAGGLVALVPALSIMLGANVGTTLIVQVLSFNVSAVAPLFFLAGFLCFTWGKKTWVRDIGRVMIGLGLMLIALHMLLDTLAPAEIGTPPLALAAAARETLHMGDVVETMLRETITALLAGDRKLVGTICRMDNTVDRLHEAIKLYVTK